MAGDRVTAVAKPNKTTTRQVEVNVEARRVQEKPRKVTKLKSLRRNSKKSYSSDKASTREEEAFHTSRSSSLSTTISCDGTNCSAQKCDDDARRKLKTSLRSKTKHPKGAKKETLAFPVVLSLIKRSSGCASNKENEKIQCLNSNNSDNTLNRKEKRTSNSKKALFSRSNMKKKLRHSSKKCSHCKKKDNGQQQGGKGDSTSNKEMVVCVGKAVLDFVDKLARYVP